MDKDVALEEVLTLAGRLARENAFEVGAGELCRGLAGLGEARALALFGVLPGGAGFDLIGAFGLPVDYLRRFPPREARPFAQLPGDLRDALQRVEVVSVSHLDGDPRTLSLTGVARQGDFQSTLSIPIVLERQTIGLLHVFYGQDAPSSPDNLLVRLTPLLANALSRDRLSRALHDVDRRTSGGLDPVVTSGLHSRGPLERVVQHAHAVADRYGSKYAVVLYAVDHVDRLASRYGAALVEEAIHELGLAVAHEHRAADQAGYADELALLVVLPQTLERGAFSQAERTLQRFSRVVFRHGDDRLQLSASASISCYPENGAQSGTASVDAARETLATALGTAGQRLISIAATCAASPPDPTVTRPRAPAAADEARDPTVAPLPRGE